MQKILHIFSRHTIGGAERLVLAFARQADPQKYAVSVAAAREGIVRNIFGFVKREHPDIVHTHLFSGDCVGYVLKRMHPEIRWISTQHNVESHAPLYKRVMWKRILQKADVVVPVSAVVEEWAREGFGIAQKKIRRISNAPTEKFLEIPPLADTAPTVWRLASIGRLEKQKGHDIFFAALRELEDMPWRASVYGEGSQTYPHGDRITYEGIGDTTAILCGAEIVVQPSRWEGRSLAVMEAMAAGRCVVASAAAGAELVEDGKTGVIVPTEDSHALADALRRLMEHPSEVARLGANAREYARAHFDFAAWMRTMDELYQSV